MTTPSLILASASKGRQQLMQNAGLPVDIHPSRLDETAIKQAFLGDGSAGDLADLADVLARAKAETVSAAQPGRLVVGADQLLTCDGEIYAKPPNRDAAAEQLLKLRGKTHNLETAVCCARDGETIWTHRDTARMTMRDFSPEFLGQYLSDAGEGIFATVGGYQIEGSGAQLFSRIEGSYFTIVGLPLLPLLDFLRTEGILKT